jgi:hypothetical protein
MHEYQQFRLSSEVLEFSRGGPSKGARGGLARRLIESRYAEKQRQRREAGESQQNRREAPPRE